MPVGKGRDSPIAADDQARAIAALLRDPEAHIGETIQLSGPAEMDHEQMASELAEALGYKIVFQDIPVDEYVASTTERGVPSYIVQHLGGAMVDHQHGHMAGADNNVEKLTVGEYASCMSTSSTPSDEINWGRASTVPPPIEGTSS